MKKHYEYIAESSPYINCIGIQQTIFKEFQKKGFSHLHISGSAGSGKTRLVCELLKHVDQLNTKATVYSDLCLQSLHSHDSVLLNLLQKLMIECGYSLHSDESQKKLISDLAFDRDYKDLLQSISGNRYNNSQGILLENMIMALVTKLMQTSKVVIVFEDIHWGNDMRDSFIKRIKENFADHDNDFSLITTSRSDDYMKDAFNLCLDEFWDKNALDSMMLEQYKSKSGHTLLNDELIKAMGRNPYLISDFVRLYNQLDNLQPLVDLIETTDQVTAKDLCGIQLEHLNDLQKSIIMAGSVIGPKFHLDILKILLPHYKGMVDQAARGLVQQKIIRPTDIIDEYEFIHQLQYEAIYSHIDAVSRQSWNYELFRFYKSCSITELKNKFELCGHHLLNAEFYEEAIPYLSYVAKRSLRTAQPQKAQDFFDRAIKAYEIINKAFYVTVIKLKISYCQALLMQGDIKKAKQIRPDLKKYNSYEVQKYDDAIQTIDIAFKWYTGSYEKDYVLNKFHSLENTQSNITDKHRLLAMLSDIGEFELSNSMMNQFYYEFIARQKYYKEQAFTSTISTCMSIFSNNFAALGNHEKAYACIDENMSLIKEFCNPAHKIHGLTFTAIALQRMQEYERALPIIEEAFNINNQVKIGIIRPTILTHYAHNLTKVNNYITALSLFDECMDFIKKCELEVNKSVHQRLMAQAYYEMGMRQIAAKIAIESMNTATKHNNAYQHKLAYDLLRKIESAEEKKKA